MGVARELCGIPTFEAHREEQQLVQRRKLKRLVSQGQECLQKEDARHSYQVFSQLLHTEGFRNEVTGDADGVIHWGPKQMAVD